MSEFKKILGEIKKTLRKILLFDIFIETLLVYLCLYLLFLILNITKIAALLPALGYFIFMVIKKRRLTDIRTVEQKYPILNEALRTVSDTLDEDNYLVNQLRDEVKQKVTKVTASSFMDIKGDVFKIILTVGLVFVILSLSICKGTSNTCNSILERTDIPATIKKINVDDLYSQLKKETISELDLSGQGIDDNIDVDAKNMVLAENTEIKLGDNKVRIKIKLTNDQIDIHDVNDEVQKKEFMGMDITEINAINDVNFEEEISMEHKEIVKNYFNTISK